MRKVKSVFASCASSGLSEMILWKTILITLRYIKATASLFTLLLIVGWTPSSFADATDRNKEAQLEADQVDFDAKNHQGIYHGHVTFIQGSSHLEADDALTTFDEHNQIAYAKASASNGRSAHFWTSINPKDPDFHASAKQIEFFPKKHLIVLTGEAQITQGKNKMSSPVIEYNIITHHMVTRMMGNARTRLYIYPDKKHE